MNRVPFVLRSLFVCVDIIDVYVYIRVYTIITIYTVYIYIYIRCLYMIVYTY